MGRGLPSQLPNPRAVEIPPDGLVIIHGAIDPECEALQASLLRERDEYLADISALQETNTDGDNNRRKIARLKRKIGNLNRNLPPQLRKLASSSARSRTKVREDALKPSVRRTYEALERFKQRAVDEPASDYAVSPDFSLLCKMLS